MPTHRLSWFAVLATAVVCLALDGTILGVLLLLAGDVKTTALVFVLGGGPITLFVAGPLYSWFKARDRLTERLTDKSARLRARQ